MAEGELRSNIDESDKVRDLQDKVADLKAEVYKTDLSGFCYTQSINLDHQIKLISLTRFSSQQTAQPPLCQY